MPATRKTSKFKQTMDQSKSTSNITRIKIGRRDVTLAATDRALFEFQAQGGKISALFDIEHSYLHGIRLLYACLDAETRGLYAQPPDLCKHVGKDDTEVFTAVFTAAIAAGWFPTAAELRDNIDAAKTALAVVTNSPASA